MSLSAERYGKAAEMGANVGRAARGPEAPGEQGERQMQPGRWCEMCEFGKCGIGTQLTAAPEAVYTITTYTGTAPGSGSDAKVCITMYGHSGGTSPRIELSENTAVSLSSLMGREGGSLHNLRHAARTTMSRFESGSVDMFSVQVPPFGDPTRIRIGHDNSGLGPGWFLSKVVIERTAGGPSATWEFHCERWLDTDRDDSALERELVARGHEGVGVSGTVVAATASCSIGPSLVLSKQSTAVGLLAWSIRVAGSNSLICIGAAPTDCKALDSTPPDGAAWCVTAASGMTSPLGGIQCSCGDRFRVVADLDHGALTVMRLDSKATSDDKWQLVAACDHKLSGEVRLCLCLWGGAEVELLQDHEQGFRQLLVTAQKRHHQKQLEALRLISVMQHLQHHNPP